MRYLILILFLAGCAGNPVQEKRDRVISCVKELKQNDSETMDAFEVCRQLYGVKKVK